MVGIRLVTAHGETTRRIDLQLVGSRGLAVEDGLVTTSRPQDSGRPSATCSPRWTS